MLRFPPRRILVAVEFSKESLYAWNAAKAIAERFGAVLEAVWCAPGYRAAGLRRLRARLGADARLHAVKGDPISAIRRLARDRSVDLLVMGTSRRPGIERWAQGSVAEAVVRVAPCPVLVVPRAWRSPRKVLAPVNEAAYSRRGLLAAAVVARAYGGHLTMLEVIAKPALAPYSAKRMRLQAAKLPAAVIRDLRPELKVRVGNPIKEILRAERSQDMIVLVMHRKSLFGDMVIGTTVERVLRHSRIPVLAIPSP